MRLRTKPGRRHLRPGRPRLLHSTRKLVSDNKDSDDIIKRGSADKVNALKEAPEE